MASMSDALETAILELLFKNTTLANVGDATGIAGGTVGSTELSLNTTALTDASTSIATNEISYTGYARPTQARSAAGWTVSGGVASNAALITFGEMTAGAGGTAVHTGLTFDSGGVVLHLHADLTADLAVTNGITPQFAIGVLTWTAA